MSKASAKRAGTCSIQCCFTCLVSSLLLEPSDKSRRSPLRCCTSCALSISRVVVLLCQWKNHRNSRDFCSSLTLTCTRSSFDGVIRTSPTPAVSVSVLMPFAGMSAGSVREPAAQASAGTTSSNPKAAAAFIMVSDFRAVAAQPDGTQYEDNPDADTNPHFRQREHVRHAAKGDYRLARRTEHVRTCLEVSMRVADLITAEQHHTATNVAKNAVAKVVTAEHDQLN